MSKYSHGERISKHRLMPILGAALAVVILVVAFSRFANKPDDVMDANTDVITYSTNEPDEIKPGKQSYQWRGAADEPRYIKLPTIEVEGFIQKVGVDQNQEIAVPTNIHIAGWFVDSVKPGQPGLSIIDGHINGRGSDGIFVNLEKLKKGDTYTVEFGDGTSKEFKVTDVTSVETKDAPSVLFSQDPNNSSQLNLITCGGNFDTNSRSYDKRVIISSVPVN